LFSEFSPELAPDVRLRSLTVQAKCQRALPNAIHLAAWSNHGATVVRIEEGTAAVHVNIRVEQHMSLLGTTTGRVFGAFLPPKMIETFIKSGVGDASALRYDDVLTSPLFSGLFRTASQSFALKPL
jgi:DNA-binding IclR family transcriptional regulator